MVWKYCYLANFWWDFCHLQYCYHLIYILYMLYRSYRRHWYPLTFCTGPILLLFIQLPWNHALYPMSHPKILNYNEFIRWTGHPNEQDQNRASHAEQGIQMQNRASEHMWYIKQSASCESSWLYGLLKIYYWLLGQLDIRSYWLCGQFALDKTVDHITTENSTIAHLGIKFSWIIILYFLEE